MFFVDKFKSSIQSKDKVSINKCEHFWVSWLYTIHLFYETDKKN